MVVGLEAAVGQGEDGLGLEPVGEGGDGPAVVGVGRGGVEAGGLPEGAPEEAEQLAEDQAGPDRAWPPLSLPAWLDERLDPAGQGRGVEPAGGRRSRRRGPGGTRSGRGRPAPGPGRRSPRPAGPAGRRPRGCRRRPVRAGRRPARPRAGGRTGRPGIARGSCRAGPRPRCRSGSGPSPAGGSSRVLRKALAASSFRSSASSTMATLRRPLIGLRPRSRQRSRITRIGSSCLSSGRATRRRSGWVPAITWRQPGHSPQGSSSASGTRSQSRAWASRRREGPLADPLGADEQEGVREPALGQRPSERRRPPGHDLGASARARATSLCSRAATDVGVGRAVDHDDRRRVGPRRPGGTPRGPGPDSPRPGPRSGPAAGPIRARATSGGTSTTRVRSGSRPPVAARPTRQRSSTSSPPAYP